MQSALHSDEFIEAVIRATYGENASPRVYYLYRESLRSLVRLAKIEHASELDELRTISPSPSPCQLVH